MSESTSSTWLVKVVFEVSANVPEALTSMTFEVVAPDQESAQQVAFDEAKDILPQIFPGDVAYFDTFQRD